MDVNLNGKVAVVTGGTAGIGQAVAECFAREGARVAICSSRQANVDRTIQEFQAKGLNVYGEELDVSSRQGTFNFADRVEAKLGGINIWVSNASIMIEKKIIDTSEELWDRTMEVNLKSVYYGGLVAAAKMRRSGGVLINAASFASLIPSIGSGAYAASKAAIANMTRTLAGELAPFHIRVVGFIPGVIATPMTNGWLSRKGELLASQHALNRIGRTDEIAKALLFLASEHASFITGTCLEITGGKFCVQNPSDGWI